MPDTKPITFTYADEVLRIVTTQFHDGNLAVVVIDDVTCEPWARLSVNLPHEKPLPEGAFWLKDWSENADMAAQLVEDEVLIPVTPARIAIVGHVWAEAYRLQGTAVAS